MRWERLFTALEFGSKNRAEQQVIGPPQIPNTKTMQGRPFVVSRNSIVCIATNPKIAIPN